MRNNAGLCTYLFHSKHIWSSALSPANKSFPFMSICLTVELLGDDDVMDLVHKTKNCDGSAC